MIETMSLKGLNGSVSIFSDRNLGNLDDCDLHRALILARVLDMFFALSNEQSTTYHL